MGGERPDGVADVVEDHLLMRNATIRYGVMARSGTPFWGWLEGCGWNLVWTSSGMADIETKLGTVDAILFDRAFP
jgi:hypothetical protein